MYMTFKSTRCNAPSFGCVEITTTESGNHASSPSSSNSARITWFRRAAKSTTVYLPGTHPTFEVAVSAMMSAAVENENDGDKIKISKWNANILATAIRKLRIGIVVDTRGITTSELEDMCVEKIAEEAFAFATYEIATGQAKFVALDVYNFVKQSRIDIETEIQRCKKDKTEPTPHATMSELSLNRLRNIFPHMTIHHKFMSVGALLKAINCGIMQFLTWPERELDRIAVVEEILNSNMENVEHNRK